MVSAKVQALAAILASIAVASPCPYGDLAERGMLPANEAENFYAARSAGESAVEHQMKQRSELEKREHVAQEKFYKRQLDLGELSLGGGLLNGVLQPFSGVLESLDIPM